jgi:Family of unknown function (DUF5906)
MSESGGSFNPVAVLRGMLERGHDINNIAAAMNNNFAVVKYGGQIMVATIIGDDISFMKVDDFHKMLANLTVRNLAVQPGTTPVRPVKLSKYWFDWQPRRQFCGRGVIFEPGRERQIAGDMFNLWRGFGVEPKQGDWSLMRNHIRDVICSGNEELFQYLIKWMAYGVQYPDRPIGVSIALRGEEGAGKGFLWRNYGKLYGRHFKHVAQGEHLTGRFNAVLGDACAVFLDEAIWAGHRRGEQILKALITEDTFQLERKFCDPIPVRNCLRIMIASNNQWIVPVGTRGRRFVVIDVSDQYAKEDDPTHVAYWEPLQAQFGDRAPDDGRAAMLYDLLHTDLSNFNVRAVPKSAAKTEQKLLSQRGTEAWLFEVLQDGEITVSSYGSRSSISKWDENGMHISIDDAYDSFSQFSQARREYPRGKEWWSRDLRKIMKKCMSDVRPRTENSNRKRQLTFRPLDECRKAYEQFMGADIEWRRDDETTTEASERGGETKAPEWACERDPIDEYEKALELQSLWEPPDDVDVDAEWGAQLRSPR